ncbi:HD domain-containing protein [Ruegeria sp. SCPT10]|uniref:HD domain-containing protein n=1 Tax=Ruegeria sp. SCP10 TaxID=3141377 RepID=UPI0033363967
MSDELEVLLKSLTLEASSSVADAEARQDVDQIYKLFDLERTIRFFGQRYWENESRFESARPGLLQLENVAAHSFQVANTVMLLGSRFPNLDIAKAIELAIVHDQLEMITGDKDPVGRYGDGSDTHAFSVSEREAKTAEEAAALKDFASNLAPNAAVLYYDLISEATAEKTLEAKFVKAIDKLQALAFVRVKKVGDLGPSHLSFTIRYSREGVKKFPQLQQHFSLILEDLLTDVERVFPANFHSYCKLVCDILDGNSIPPRDHLRQVALIGKSGAGKSTVAKLLNYHAGAERISSGAICRQIAKLLFGNDDKSTTQTLDDALTKIDPSVFVNAALLTAPVGRPICLDSLRFKSDYEIAKRRGFTVVRVIAPDDVRVARLTQRGQRYDLVKDGSHRSETELDEVDVDYTVENSGDIEALENSVRTLIG